MDLKPLAVFLLFFFLGSGRDNGNVYRVAATDVIISRKFCKVARKSLLSGNAELTLVEMHFDIVPSISMLVLLSVNVFVTISPSS